jgi:hypothetical protein
MKIVILQDHPLSGKNTDATLSFTDTHTTTRQNILGLRNFFSQTRENNGY